MPLTERQKSIRAKPSLIKTFTETPEPGIYPGVPFAKYLACKHLSQSVIKHGRRWQQLGSMRALKYAWDRGVEPTDAMNQGSALHCCWLEAMDMLNRFVLWAGASRRGKEWEAFKEQNCDRIILTQAMWENTQQMIAALKERQFIINHRCPVEQIETSVIWVDGPTQLPLRMRVDVADSGAGKDAFLVDLKSTKSVRPRDFQNQAFSLGYHIQAALYIDGWRASTGEDRKFKLLAVESAESWDVAEFDLDADLIGAGREEYQAVLAEVKYCLQTGVWPGRNLQPVKLSLPAWVTDDGDSSLVIDGETVEV